MERGDSGGNNLWADRIQEYDDGCQGHQRENALRPSEADGRRPSDRETGVLWLSPTGGVPADGTRQAALWHRLSDDGMGHGASQTDIGLRKPTYQRVSNDGCM